MVRHSRSRVCKVSEALEFLNYCRCRDALLLRNRMLFQRFFMASAEHYGAVLAACASDAMVR